MKYVLKITLTELSEPAVWRTIAIPGNYTFFKLHKVIQIAFGWESMHFFEFIPECNGDAIHIYMPHEDDFDDNEMNFLDATKTKVDDVLGKGVKCLLYIYDRNDNWTHKIVVESSSDENISRPQCIDGGGMCPPEGCNGAQGYEYIKKILSERPDSDEAVRCREWMFMDDDEVFDPDYFTEAEIEEINNIYKL